MVHAETYMDTVVANDIVQALLAIGGEVADQILEAGEPSAFENCEREAWKPTREDLVGR